ncbi:MAG: glycosyltransferase, partial [Oricola sp.]
DGTPQSWVALNPGWDYRLWTDDDLLVFVRDEFPDLLELYQSYPNPVQRADLARYMLLYRFGGVYADMDTDCLAPFDPLASDDRVILCEEPVANWEKATQLGMERLYFNGTMASPAGHPFWRHVLDYAWKCRHAAPKDVLDSTGPLMFSGAIFAYPRQEELALNSCHLFAPSAPGGREDAGEPYGDYAAMRLSRHNWAGTWFHERKEGRYSRLKGKWRKRRALASKPAGLTLGQVEARIDRAALSAPLVPFGEQSCPNVVVFVPVRNGADFIARNFELVRSLDYPAGKLRLVYCEGDSTDGSRAMLERLKAECGGSLRGLEILDFSTGLTLGRRQRWEPDRQLARRGAIARVRNHLIRHGLAASDDWVLWLDVDVCDFPRDILKTLLRRNRKIVTPNCVLEAGGPSYDLNAFLEIGEPRPSLYYKHVVGGLFQPPANYWHRRHLHDLRYLDEVPLSSVGATMLLVHASVHRAGLEFPEIPYNDLIETEAFGRLAGELGVTPVGLPNIEIIHVKS